MKVGVLSDIHGNYTALETVLDDMPSVDCLVSLGDNVGYGPHPKQVVETVHEQARCSLYGNHESYLNDPELCSDNTDAHEGILHARSELTDEQFNWAVNSPHHNMVENELFLAHGHPDPETPFKYVTTSNVTEMVPYFREGDFSLLAVGHSHVQFKQDLSKFHDEAGVVFNPGSVGQPRDKDPRAAYAVADTDTETVSLHRVGYDVESVVADVKKAGLPTNTGERLRTGSYPSSRR